MALQTAPGATIPEPDFTSAQVLQLYDQLRSGQSRQVKDQANAQILIFLNSQKAWVIANELITQGQTSDQ